MKSVLLALSGGVDSAVAALLLKKKYRVIGVFMKNFSDIKDKLTGECNWVEEYEMAQKMAAHLNIPLIKLDFEKQYKNLVLKPMFLAYKHGLTPNPDITCNTIIKFPLLWKQAKKLKCDYIATGHYARIKSTSEGYELLQGKDKTKDQSYFLAEATQSDLQHTLFPIGNLNKEHVRKIAKKHGFPNYDKKSTSGVCFIGNIPLKSFLEKKIKSKPGKVLDENRNIIGTHKGSHLYTIGERAKESIGIKIQKGALAQERFYIAKKDTKNNTITIVPENHPLLLKSSFKIKKIHFINPKDNRSNIKCKVRIRHLGTLHNCKLTGSNVRLAKAISGISPGQYAVFYQKDKVLASGEIKF